MKNTKVLIADDHEVVRDGLRNILTSLENISSVAEVGNGEEAVNMYNVVKPDLVIMDISMPGMNGIEATRIIKQNDPNAKILILTMHDNQEYQDNKGVAPVSGEVQGRLADEVRRAAQAAVARLPLPPRTGIAFTSEYEEQEKNQAFLGKAFLIGVLLIALVLVTEFNSLRISFIILFTVVLSLMGVIIGLLVTGFPFGVIMNGIGVISLGGIVVNNAIVLLDFIEKLRAGGMPLREALITAGRIRLRPVTLGAISTVVGLVQVALGIDIDFVNLRVVFGSESSQWWESLAIPIIFGATVATAVTLVMVPTFYRAFFKEAGPETATAAAGEGAGNG